MGADDVYYFIHNGFSAHNIKMPSLDQRLMQYNDNIPHISVIFRLRGKNITLDLRTTKKMLIVSLVLVSSLTFDVVPDM